MALWIDRDWVSSADLTAIDSEVPKIMSANGIDADGEGGIIREAFYACSNWLVTRFPSSDWLASDPVANIGCTVANRFKLEQVVMADSPVRTPLRDWLLKSTLSAFYRSALRRTLNDRFQAKLDIAVVEEAKALIAVQQAGVPVVLSPLPCPVAIHAPWFDFVSAPSATPTADVGKPARTLYWAVTFATGTEESSPSATYAATISADQSHIISIAPALPPAWASWFAVPKSWKLYAGTTQRALRLVSSADLGTTITLASAGTGAALGYGQVAAITIPFRNLILRG